MEPSADHSSSSPRQESSKKKAFFFRWKKRNWMKFFISIDNSLNTLTSLVIKSSILILAGTLVFILYKELRDDSYVINAFDMPKKYQYDGYDGTIVANMMLDKVVDIQKQAQTSKETNQFTHTGARSLMDLQIMGMGFSVNAMVYHIRKALGVRHNQIKGEIIKQADKVMLTLRMTGFDPVSFSEPLEDTLNYHGALNALITKAGEEIVRITEPYQLAVYYENKGNNEKAINILKQIIASRPKDRKWAYNLWGNILKSAKVRDFEKAVYMYEKSISIDPDFPLPYSNLGRLRYDEGNYQQALEYYEKALAIDPENGFSLAQSGVTYSQIEDYRKASERFEKAIEIGVIGGWVYSAWANVEEKQGRIDKAEQLYLKGYDENPENTWLLGNMMAMFIKSGQFEKAKSVFEEVNSISPDDNNVYTNYSYGLYSVGKYQEAFELVKEIAERNQEAFAAHLLMALYAAALEDFETADTKIEECFQMVPDEPIVFIVRAGIYHHKKDTLSMYKDLRTGFEKGFNNQDSDLVSQLPFSDYHDETEFKQLVQDFKINIIEP